MSFETFSKEPTPQPENALSEEELASIDRVQAYLEDPAATESTKNVEEMVAIPVHPKPEVNQPPHKIREASDMTGFGKESLNPHGFTEVD